LPSHVRCGLLSADQLIKHTEDLKFLQLMKGERSATFGSCDTVLAAKIQRGRECEHLETARQQKMDQVSTEGTTTTVADTAGTDEGLRVTGE
jgi:hypothetical protein